MRISTAGLRSRLSQLMPIAAVVLAVAIVDAAPAQGESLLDMHCVGPSPNIIDMPYSAQVLLSQYKQPGSATVTVHTGPSIWGYSTRPTLTWTNLNGGRTGTASGNAPVSNLFGEGATVIFYNLPTGAGPIRFDLSVVNAGIVPTPPVTCSSTGTVA